MAWDLLGGVVDTVGKLIDKVIPDRAAADAAKAELLRLQVNGELQLALAQLQVNTEEAKSASAFTSGWRPFIGWVCGAALAYQYLIRPIAVSVAAYFNVALPAVGLDENLWQLLFGMLGLGAMRSYDKVKGTAK